MTSPKVTAILMSWKRKPNMPRIIEALRNQTMPIEIWLINNNGFEDFGADRLVAFPWQPLSAGEWARYPIAARVETEYCMFQDDDFLLADNDFVEDAISLHDEYCAENILGISGRLLSRTPPHYAADIKEGYAHIIKGHFQLFKTNIVRRIRLPRLEVSSDIYWSLDAANGQPSHYVSGELAGRVTELPRHGVGYEFRPEHYAERERVCSEWLREYQYA